MHPSVSFHVPGVPALLVHVLRSMLLLTVCFPLRGHSVEAGSEVIAPIHAPFEMPSLQRPTFPNRRISICDFGATEGGEKKNTAAFAGAIASCARQGGGHVVVPKGKWLTGPIHLQSNIDLHLDDGAEISFSDDFADYLPPVFVRSGGVEIYNFSPLIYARDCENVAVTGAGLLEGNGKAWWQERKAVGTAEPFRMSAEGVPVEKRVFDTVEKGIRPSFVSFIQCRNVLLEGFAITSGPAWTIHPVYCENVIIRRLRVDTHGPNNDGMDPDSCRNVLVENCTFTTGDDCLVLKSGYNEDGWRVGKPTENVVVRHCSATEGHGGLVIGSEMSGGVRNVFMQDCEFDGTDHAVRIKSRLDRGGIVENVWVRDVRARNLKRDVVLLTMNYGSDKQAILHEKPPTFRHMFLQNIAADAVPAAIIITGTAQIAIQDIHFSNLTIRAEKGVSAQFIKDCTFEDVEISALKGPVFDLTDACDICLRPKAVPPIKGGFLKLHGKDSSGILIQTGQPQAEKPVCQLDDDVAKDAVTLE